IGAEQRIDPRVVLDGQHIQAQVVAQQELVDDFLEEIGGDLGIAKAIGQAGAHGVRRVEHVLRYERVRDFALPPSVHLALPEPSQRLRNFTTISTNALACSISGWCPARSISSKRAPGIKSAYARP